ncbi:hypothetical protein ACJX0J_026379, partial [Zea mays]
MLHTLFQSLWMASLETQVFFLLLLLPTFQIQEILASTPGFRWQELVNLHATHDGGIASCNRLFSLKRKNRSKVINNFKYIKKLEGPAICDQPLIPGYFKLRVVIIGRCTRFHLFAFFLNSVKAPVVVVPAGRYKFNFCHVVRAHVYLGHANIYTPINNNNLWK